MKKIKIAKTNMVIYDGIDELPIVNFREYNRYVLIDSGIGSDMQSVDSHLASIIRFIKLGKSEEATKELLNMRQNIALVMAGTNLKMMSFVPLIYSIDGKRVTDLSDENIKSVLEMLNRRQVSYLNVASMLAEVKKKSIQSLTSCWRVIRGRQANRTSTTSVSRSERS